MNGRGVAAGGEQPAALEEGRQPREEGSAAGWTERAAAVYELQERVAEAALKTLAAANAAAAATS